MKALKCIALILVIVGALNWGLWGFFQFDLVAWLCGGNTTGTARLIYSLVGLSGLWSISLLCRWKACCCNYCPKCGKECSSKKHSCK